MLFGAYNGFKKNRETCVACFIFIMVSESKGHNGVLNGLLLILNNLN